MPARCTASSGTLPRVPSGPQAVERYFALGQDSEPISVRHLFDITPAAPALDLASVEPREAIFARFGAGAISFGAINAETQRDIILAMRDLGGRSSSGEGGENPFYYRDGITTPRPSRSPPPGSA